MSDRLEPVAGLIIGCGIAGPALAVGLARAGIESVIFEASEKPRDDEGVFLNLAPNGLDALRALGLADVVQGLGFVNDRIVFHNERGRVLADLPVGARTLMRGALGRALREAALQRGISIEFGKRLESVEERGTGVIARFSDGSVRQGRFLIGADGIHSRSRSAVFPRAPEPTYTGVINLGGVTQTDLPETGTASHMVFGRRAFFGYTVLASGETYWFSNYPQGAEPTCRELEQPSVPEYRERLLKLHADDPPEVSHILGTVREGIGAYAVYDILSLPQWSSRLVCLVGDAAHAIGPHVGQGASLALEDAFVLAKCLRDLRDPAWAFATFERLRRDRVERIVQRSRRTGKRKSPGGWFGRTVRDLVLPTFLRRGAQGLEWMYSYPMDWDEPVEEHAERRAA